MRNLLSNKHFKLLSVILLVVIFSAFTFVNVLADNSDSSSSILAADKTLDKTGFFSGNIVDIAGTVNGNAFVAGSDIKISGTINGDLFVAGQNINITGTVSGSIFTAGQNINIKGDIENNIYSAGSKINISSKSNGSGFLAGEIITIEEKGDISKDLFAGSGQLFQYGRVGRDATITAEDLYIESGQIDGDLKYKSKNKALISKDSTISGKTDWNKVEPQPKKNIYDSSFFISKLFGIISLMVVWIAFKLIRPDFWSNISIGINNHIFKSIGFGALTFIVVPTVIFFALISVVLFPLAFLLSAMYGIALYLSKIIVSVSIGQLIQTKFNLTSKHKGVWLVLLGLLIVSTLSIIPIIGAIVKIATIMLGLGSIILYLSNNNKTIDSQ